MLEKIQRTLELGEKNSLELQKKEKLAKKSNLIEKYINFLQY
jgi:hypothetical protein